MRAIDTNVLVRLITRDVPIGTIFELKRGKKYKLTVTCKLPENRPLRSNELEIQA